RSVLVLDEAGMLPTRELAQVVERTRALEVKLVLVGDHRQLAAIGPGGAFRALMARLPAIELKENRRQAAQWERDALRLVRDGDAGAVFSAGDRVVVRRNDRALGVVNGDRGVVVAVDPARGRIDLALPRGQVSLPRDYLECPTRHGRPALQHGYAITAHLAQG